MHLEEDLEVRDFIDFGSTYTKIVCVDLSEKRVVLTDKFPSTVHTDAGIACSSALKLQSALSETMILALR